MFPILTYMHIMFRGNDDINEEVAGFLACEHSYQRLISLSRHFSLNFLRVHHFDPRIENTIDVRGLSKNVVGLLNSEKSMWISGGI